MVVDAVGMRLTPLITGRRRRQPLRQGSGRATTRYLDAGGSRRAAAGPDTLSLLGLMAKIKCSICSYQFNIWYAGHSPAQILIWFLEAGRGMPVHRTLTAGCLGVALQPCAAQTATRTARERKDLREAGARAVSNSVPRAAPPRSSPAAFSARQPFILTWRGSLNAIT